MEYQSVIGEHRSQVKFYQLLCLALVFVLGILSIVVPTTLKAGPYIIQDTESLLSVSRSQPWKLTVSRVEGFLKLYLNGRFNWSKENFAAQKDILTQIISDAALNKLKDSLISIEAIAKTQGARSFYILEGYRFSNQQKVIEAQVSRVIRVGSTGVVTPLLIHLYFEEASVTEQNPYGLQITSLEEIENR